MSYLIVFLGAGIGGSLRHGVNVIVPRLFGTALPFGTMFVNIAGSLTMGLIIGYLAFRGEAAQMQRLFLTTGILGGFTTFSAFSLDVSVLLERGDLWNATIYGALSVGGSILALFAGLWFARAVF